jgi:hypothetical protein
MNSINKTARMAGFLYLITVPLGILGILYVPSTLLVSGDAASTVNNIMANDLLFRLSIISALFIQVCYIFIVLLLYKLLKSVNQNQALLMVVFMLVSIPITMFNEVNNLAALLLAGDTGYLSIFTVDQVQALVLVFLDFHKYGINIASIFWGLWLLPMGYLVFKSDFIPKFVGVALLITGFGYVVDFFIVFLFPSSAFTVGAYTGFWELLFPLWLAIKGVNVEKWEKRALVSA